MAGCDDSPDGPSRKGFRHGPEGWTRRGRWGTASQGGCPLAPASGSSEQEVGGTQGEAGCAHTHLSGGSCLTAGGGAPGRPWLDEAPGAEGGVRAAGGSSSAGVVGTAAPFTSWAAEGSVPTRMAVHQTRWRLQVCDLLGARPALEASPRVSEQPFTRSTLDATCEDPFSCERAGFQP